MVNYDINKKIPIIIFSLLIILTIYKIYRISQLKINKIIVKTDEQENLLSNYLNIYKKKYFICLTPRLIKNYIKKQNKFFYNIKITFSLQEKKIIVTCLYDTPILTYKNFLITKKGNVMGICKNIPLTKLNYSPSINMAKTIANNIYEIFPYEKMQSIDFKQGNWQITTIKHKTFFLGSNWGKAMSILKTLPKNKIANIINKEGKYKNIYLLNKRFILMEL